MMQALRSGAFASIRRSLSTSPAIEPLYILTYKYPADILEKRAPFRAAHLDLALQLRDSGSLIYAGGALSPCVTESGDVEASTAPTEGVFIFKSKVAALSFAGFDEYTKNGVVTDWSVREWSVAVGPVESPTTPKSSGGLGGVRSFSSSSSTPTPPPEFGSNGVITKEQLTQALTSPTLSPGFDFIVIDVRPKAERLFDGGDLHKDVKYVPLMDIISGDWLEEYSEEEFKDKYGFDKPEDYGRGTKHTTYAFVCKAGVRSQMARNRAKEVLDPEQTQVQNYEGGANEWFTQRTWST
jgi:uncharacterized protein YciI/rhodanese-related sulfurtransferase